MNPGRLLVIWIIPLLCCGSLTTGCSGGGTSSSPRTIPASAYKMKSPPTYNEWDLKFIKGAYLSHTEVTRMLRRTSERTDNVHVRTLATGLLSVRAGELQMLSSWLADWDMPRPKSTGTDKATQGINKLSGTDYDKKRRSQPVSAPPAAASRSLSSSAGVLKLRVRRGRSFKLAAISLSCG